MDLPVLKGVEQVSDGWLKKFVLTYDLPDGRGLNYEVVSRKGLEQYGAEIRGKAAAGSSTDAVCIVGHTADDAFLLIREFRFPMNRMCVAFPAGLKEANEDVIECAARELREETGYDLVRNEDGSPANARMCLQPGYSSLGWGRKPWCLPRWSVYASRGLSRRSSSSRSSCPARRLSGFCGRIPTRFPFDASLYWK
ncbi:MAG: NUDIX domain-containing protein [Slackia sp.]